MHVLWFPFRLGVGVVQWYDISFGLWFSQKATPLQPPRPYVPPIPRWNHIGTFQPSIGARRKHDASTAHTHKHGTPWHARICSPPKPPSPVNVDTACATRHRNQHSRRGRSATARPASPRCGAASCWSRRSPACGPGLAAPTRPFPPAAAARTPKWRA